MGLGNHTGKDIENRQWFTRYRGPICIHAAKGMTKDEYMDFIHTAHRISQSHWFPPSWEIPAINEFDRGGIVGVADLVDCVGESESPWFAGRWGFVLHNAQPVEFIPGKGALGLFDWREPR